MILFLMFSACSQSAEPKAEVSEHAWHEPCPKSEREQRMLPVNGIELNVACRGEGPTVVFLHGFPEFHYSWNAVMDELADDYRLVAPDQRGYNLSDKPEDVDSYHLSHLYEDVVQLLPLVSSDPVLLVAHDWGGPVGWLVAHDSSAPVRGFMSTNGPHPLRFAELLATDAAQQEASEYMNFFRTPGFEDGFTPEVAVAMFDFLNAADREIYLTALGQEGAILGGLNWYRANDLSVEGTEAVMTMVDPVINVPVFVMWGEEDEAVLTPNSQQLDSYASDLHVSTYPGVDHWIEHRIPETIADKIRELDSISP